MKIFIGADHAGFDLKEKLKVFLGDQGHQVLDQGAFEFNADDDYPDFIRPVAQAVAKEPESRGIIIGGSGFGEAMCANRTKGVRALIFYGPMVPQTAIDVMGNQSTDPYEIIRLSRSHNDSNILSIGARFIKDDEAFEAARVFLSTTFSKEERHIRRIKELDL